MNPQNPWTRKRPPLPKPNHDTRKEVTASLQLHRATSQNNQPGLESSSYSTGLTSRPGSSFGEDLNSALPGQAVGPDLDPQQLGNSETSFPGPSTSSEFTPDTSGSPATGMESDVPKLGVSAERAGLLEIGPSEDFAEWSGFEEAVEFPEWMNANWDDSCGCDSFEDAALPCMDIDGTEWKKWMGNG